MKRVLLSTSAAMLLALASISTAASGERVVGSGSGGSGNTGGAAISHSAGGTVSGGSGVMSRGVGTGTMGSTIAAPVQGGAAVPGGNAGRTSTTLGSSFVAPVQGGAAVPGGNAGRTSNWSIPQGSRVGRMDHDHDHDHDGRMDRDHDHDHRFRGPRFVFDFPSYFPSYSYYDYNDYTTYDDDCYQWRQVPTRHGWRTLRVWVCD
jgi:hypothetical protein